MKKIITAAVVLFCSTLTLNAADQSPTVNLSTKDPNQELASGFAAAFGAIRNVPIHLAMIRDGKSVVLADVRKVTAIGAVLVIENGKGQIYIINPRDVLWVSDSPAETAVNVVR